MSEIKVSTDGFHCVENAIIYDLDESLIASGYPMRTSAPDGVIVENDLKRGIGLSNAANGNNHAHDQFMTGIRVSFDLLFSNKAWVEAERYRFLEFVSSQSTMHRITKFDFRNQCNKYVDPDIITIMENKIHDYHVLVSERDALDKDIKEVRERGGTPRNIALTRLKQFNELLVERYLQILYSNPAGFELTARMTTNYRCLKNIYNQRKDHRLPEWREFCAWIETLPYAHQLIVCDNQDIELLNS